ncbi:Imm1 family immunity protein [Singulisphaera sp. PoT]|uniref:Imm1 family immunity protein n=1 Tax=Singulisphaera sp. PoT TaxID=3411797 RepID=UPI003BF5482B
MNWILQTATSEIYIVEAAQLERELWQLQSICYASPEIVTLNAPDGAFLCIGLGYDLVPLTWIASEGWPSKHLFGDVDINKLQSFMMGGHYTETPEAQTVPFERAIAVAIEFFETQTLSESVEWEDD